MRRHESALKHDRSTATDLAGRFSAADPTFRLDAIVAAAAEIAPPATAGTCTGDLRTVLDVAREDDGLPATDQVRDFLDLLERMVRAGPLALGSATRARPGYAGSPSSVDRAAAGVVVRARRSSGRPAARPAATVRAPRRRGRGRRPCRGRPPPRIRRRRRASRSARSTPRAGCRPARPPPRRPRSGSTRRRPRPSRRPRRR